MKPLTTEEKKLLPVTDLPHILAYLEEHERFLAQMEAVRRERNRQNYRNYQKRKQLKEMNI